MDGGFGVGVVCGYQNVSKMHESFGGKGPPTNLKGRGQQKFKGKVFNNEAFKKGFCSGGHKWLTSEI